MLRFVKLLYLLDPQSVRLDSASLVDYEVMNYDFNLVSSTFSLISCNLLLFLNLFQFDNSHSCLIVGGSRLLTI